MMRLKIVILACIFSFIQNAMAMESNDKITRISIATSDAVRYESRWMDNPSRLIIKFKTANVFGQLIDRTELNQGIIKNISVTYYPSEINSHEQRRIKFLTFWLSRNTPYKIWNSKDRIFIDFKWILASLLIGVYIMWFRPKEWRDFINKLQDIEGRIYSGKEKRRWWRHDLVPLKEKNLYIKVESPETKT